MTIWRYMYVVVCSVYSSTETHGCSKFVMSHRREAVIWPVQYVPRAQSRLSTSVLMQRHRKIQPCQVSSCLQFQSKMATYVTVISSLSHLVVSPVTLNSSFRPFRSPPPRLFLIKCVAAFLSPSYTQVPFDFSAVPGRGSAGYGLGSGEGVRGNWVGRVDLWISEWVGWAR